MTRRVHILNLVFCSTLMACETTVYPHVGTPEPYTLWGLLDARADTQKVRVFSVEGEPGIDRPGDIDALVSSMNLTSGERADWLHRAANYESGATGHTFWAPFRPDHGERYRVKVTRSDGASSRVDVTIPPPVDVVIDTTNRHADPRVRITGDAPHLLDVIVRYDATNLPPRSIWPPSRPLHPLVAFPVDISYQADLEPIDGGWEFVLMLRRDYERVRSEYEANCLVTEGAPDIQLRGVDVRLVVADSTWNPPGGRFDPDVLVEPNAFSNVENGFGFIGAGYIEVERWIPRRQVREDLGYAFEQPCNFAGGPRPVPECSDPPIPCMGEDAESVWEAFF